jgi:hypothetical protein
MSAPSSEATVKYSPSTASLEEQNTQMCITASLRRIMHDAERDEKPLDKTERIV